MNYADFNYNKSSLQRNGEISYDLTTHAALFMCNID